MISTMKKNELDKEIEKEGEHRERVIVSGKGVSMGFCGAGTFDPSSELD